VLPAAAGTLVSFLLLPLVVHLASNAGWFANYEQSHAGSRACADEPACDHGAVQRLDTWWDVQAQIVRFQRDLEPTHSYRSDPAGWPLLLRPVLQYRESCRASGPPQQDPCAVPPGTRAEILGLGNPALWWPALLAVPLLGWRAVGCRDVNAAAVLVVLGSLWLPWLATGQSGFLFYLVPAVPFLALTLAMAVGGLRRRRLRAQVAVVSGVLAVVLFTFFHPVLTGSPLSPGEQSARHWLPSWG